MGMFDEIVCDYPLPGTPPEFIEPGHRFQTKDFDCTLAVYRIEADGSFDVPDFTGTVTFYSSNIAGSWGAITYTRNGEDAESVGYTATFVGGRLALLVENCRERKPALPVAKMRSYQRPSDEEIRQGVERDGESLLGRRIYVLWGGGLTPGYWAEVVAEDEHKLCVKSDEHGLETMHRSGRDRTHFDSEEDAKRIRDEERAERDAVQAEYDALTKSRETAPLGEAV